MKNIFLFYGKGLSGNWFSWFINQHAGFEKSNLDITGAEFKEYNSSAVVYVTPGHQDYNPYKFVNNGKRNCMIFFCYHWYDAFLTDEISDTLNDIMKEYGDHSVVILDGQQNKQIADLMNKRNQGFVDEGLTPARTPVEEYHWEFADILNDQITSTSDILVYDITRLLGLEDAAYNELCDFLKLTPLAEWKTHVKNMMREIYGIQ